jgi:molecular chaperone HscA
LADARVEAARIALATKKALSSDSDLLEPGERERVEGALEALEQSAAQADKASRIQLAIDELDDATHDWAGRRMNRAIQQALAGKNLGAVEERVKHAAGVEEHLARHGALPEGDR